MRGGSTFSCFYYILLINLRPQLPLSTFWPNLKIKLSCFPHSNSCSQPPLRAWSCILPLRWQIAIQLTSSRPHRQTSAPTCQHKWSLQPSKASSPATQLSSAAWRCLGKDSYTWRTVPPNRTWRWKGRNDDVSKTAWFKLSTAVTTAAAKK